MFSEWDFVQVQVRMICKTQSEKSASVLLSIFLHFVCLCQRRPSKERSAITRFDEECDSLARVLRTSLCVSEWVGARMRTDVEYWGQLSMPRLTLFIGLDIVGGRGIFCLMFNYSRGLMHFEVLALHGVSPTTSRAKTWSHDGWHGRQQWWFVSWKSTGWKTSPINGYP